MAGAGISFFFAEATTKKIEVQQNLKRYGHKATGRTIDAIREEHNETGFAIYGPSHVYYLIHGRGPTGYGPFPKDTPLWERLKEWAEAKGLDINPWALAKHIHKHGTKLYRNGGNSKVLEDVFGNGYQKELESRVRQTLFLNLREQLTTASSNIQTF